MNTKQAMAVWTAAAAFGCLAGENFSVTTNGATVTVRAVDGSLPTLTEPFFGETLSVVFDASKSFRYNPAEASTYGGGSQIAAGQLTVDRDEAFGTGPVTIGTSGPAALMARDREVVLANKIVFNRSDAYAVGFGETRGCLTLKSLGTGHADRTVRLGREITGSEGRVTLSLDKADSEAVRQFGLQGALRLRLDGGVIKATADAATPFFRVVTAGDSADVTVTANGVAFDCPAGAALDLGHALKFESSVVTNAVGTCAPANGNFEEGLTGGWTYTTLPGGGSGSEIKTCSTSDHWTGKGTYPPPSGAGSRYAMLRTGIALSTTVDVPADGLWRVVFWRGGRPGGYSTQVGLSVALGGVTNAFPASADCAFVECRTPPVALSAGTHALAFVTTVGNKEHSLNIDAVSLERVTFETVTGQLVKTGEGTLLLDEQDLAGVPVSVTAGTLDLRGRALESDSTLTVSAGATLALSAYGESVVSNGSFEADGPKAYGDQAKPRNWTLKSGPTDGWGLQTNGGTLTPNGPLTPSGQTTVFLRENTSIGQTVSVAAAGTYRLSFLSADRNFATSWQIPVSVRIDGTEILAIGTRVRESGFTRHSVEVELAAGEHEIAFATGVVGSAVTLGNIVFLDDVRLCRIRATDLVVGATVKMETGSTLNLDVPGRATIESLFINGARVVGGRSAIVQAGVSVTGFGKVRAGGPRGGLLILR